MAAAVQLSEYEGLPGVDLVAEGVRDLEAGRSTRDAAKLYLTGGATSVLEGWRDTTIDVDIRLEPESDELLRRIEPDLFRYPSIDPAAFREKVERAFGGEGERDLHGR